MIIVTLMTQWRKFIVDWYCWVTLTCIGVIVIIPNGIVIVGVMINCDGVKPNC